MLRQTEKATGQAKRTQSSGENHREARRVRECRDIETAISKGYQNKQITEFFRK